MSFADRDPLATPARPLALQPARPVRLGAITAAMLLGVGLAASGPVYAQFRDWRAGNAAPAMLEVVPPSLWRTAAQPLAEWKPLIDGPDGEYLRTYTNGRADVQLYVAFYRESGFHNNLVRGMNRMDDGKVWRFASNGSAKTRIGGKETAVATTEISDGIDRLVVWQFYVVNRHVAATPFGVKLLQLHHLFGNDAGVDAFVALAARETPGGDNSADVLRGFLADFTPPGMPR